MSEPNRESILQRLRTIDVPGKEEDIVAADLVSEIIIDGGRVAFSIATTKEQSAAMAEVRERAEVAARDVPGVEHATVVLTADVPASAGGARLRSPVAGAPRPRSRQPAAGAKSAVPGVGAIIAVASGKGGVGKSTTAVNLALGLAALGQRVGILDADVYGPSLPRLLDLRDKPEKLDGRILKPLEAHGLKAMSIGLLIEEGTPMIWRGPMVISALTQLLREVAWGELDVLIVDMPPGTGDAQLTMAQQVPLAGAVIVSTPQDLALIDARRGLAMFEKVEVPVLGIVENMSTFICPHCGERTDLFGHGGAREEAEKLGVPFLGEIPLDIRIRETSDGGTPIIVAEPDSKQASAYRAVAEATLSELRARGAGSRTAPRIIIE